MVLTRSQTLLQSKLQLEKEMALQNTVKNTTTFEKTFIENMKQMIDDFNDNPTKNMTEKVQSVMKIYEYNNKMLGEIGHNARFTKYVKCIYEKSLEFEKQHKDGIFDKIQYKIVCDFMANLKKCQEFITNELHVQM